MFSIVSVAIVTIIPWLKDILAGRSKLILLVTIFYFIVFALLVSTLVLSGFAQYRRVLPTLPNIDVLEKIVNDNYQKFLNEDTKEKFKIDELSIIQKGITKDTDFKVKLVNAANIVLIITTSLIFIFAFITALLVFFI